MNLEGFKDRFKIVKVPTIEPMNRGMWTCIDFNDNDNDIPVVMKAKERADQNNSWPLGNKALQDFRDRFKIVKVETIEPIKRGRWTCNDFKDKPIVKEKSAPPLQNLDTKDLTIQLKNSHDTWP